jgi:hypothetical protein
VTSSKSARDPRTAPLTNAQLRAFVRALAAPAPWQAGPTLRRPLPQRKEYVVRIDLMDMKPPIWRRLALASDLTMEQVHAVIQVVFGWDGGHLHCFDLWSPIRQMYCERLLTAYDIEQEGETGLGEADVRLSQVLVSPGDKVSYTYDFGDDWRHHIRLEKVNDWLPAAPLAHCLTGKRATPPEDCGGVPGFESFLQNRAAFAQSGKEPDDEWEWTMAEFDPAEFDIAVINHTLAAAAENGFAVEVPW